MRSKREREKKKYSACTQISEQNIGMIVTMCSARSAMWRDCHVSGYVCDSCDMRYHTHCTDANPNNHPGIFTLVSVCKVYVQKSLSMSHNACYVPYCRILLFPIQYTCLKEEVNF